MIITLDGPTASGKSTLGRKLAKELGAYYIYSGLLYRALAYVLMQYEGLSSEKLATISLDLVSSYLDPKRFVYSYNVQNKERIFFDGRDITSYLFDSHIDKAASILSTHSAVRSVITQRVRTIADAQSVVVDGRDAGTHIFPEAQIKFYITAAESIRAARWQKKQLKKGDEFTLYQAQVIISERDSRDRTRGHAPLQVPIDAIVLDNSALTEGQTFDQALEAIHHLQS